MATKRTPKHNPAAELGQAILSAIEHRAANGEHVCSLKSIAVEVKPDVTDDEILKAAKAVPLKANASKSKGVEVAKVVVAFPDDAESLAALKGHETRLVSDDRLLRQLLTQLCSPQIPHVSLNALKTLLPKPMQPVFVSEWKRRVACNDLPGFVGVLPGKTPKSDVELHDRRFPLPWMELSVRLLTAFSTLRGSAPRAIVVSEVVEAAGGASDSLLRQAIECPPFSNSVRVVRTSGSTVWFAMQSDIKILMADDVFLQSLLQEACTTDAPEAKLTALKKHLPKDLQGPFADHWLGVVGRAEKRPFFEVIKATRVDLVLRDARFPRREVVLSEKLVQALRELKSGGLSYPCSFQRVCEHVGREAGILHAAAATGFDPWKSHVVVALPDAANSPVALAEDAQKLAAAPDLLVLLMSRHVTPEDQLVSVDKLSRTKGIHSAVQPSIQEQVERMISHRTLPAGVGAVRVSKKWHLLHMGSVVVATVSAASVSTMSAASASTETSSEVPERSQFPGSFAADFTAAFEQLDRQSGYRNYLKLLDLRTALGQYDRAEFDSGLSELGRARKFSLEGSEGSTIKLTDEERSAGVLDAGNLLVYCRRRN